MNEERHTDEQEHEEGVPFYPYHVLREATIIYLTLALALVLLVFAPPEIRPPADPFETPEHIKPEWYFLSMYQFLKLFPAHVPVLSQIPGVRAIVGEGRAASIVIQGLVVLGIILLPFFDRSPERRPRRRPAIIILGVIAVCTVIGLSVWGYLA